MAETRLTNELVKAFDGNEKIGTFKAGEKLAEFGSKQNEVNEALAANVNALIKRVCALEDQQIKNNEIMTKMANELAIAKKEVDRLRLAEKLNSGAIVRLNNAVNVYADDYVETEDSGEENDTQNA